MPRSVVLLLLLSLSFGARAAEPPPTEPLVEEQVEASEPGSFWAPLCPGAAAFVGLDAVGCLLSSFGLFLSSAAPVGGGSNCIEDCVLGIVSAGIVLLGVFIGAVGVVVLGPLAALVVTGAVTIGSAVADRAFWGAAIGGAPGILLGAAGVLVAGFGLSQMDIGVNGGLQPGLLSPDPLSQLTLLGVMLAASAGPLALAGALGGEVAATVLEEEDAPSAAAAAHRSSELHEVPLRLASASPGVAY